MKEIIIIKNRSDIGAGTRGADLGVDAIEIAAINANNDFFNNFNHVDIETENDAIYDKHITPYAKRIGKVHTVCKRLSEQVKNVLSNHNFAFVLSGDHSSALGTISGVKAAFKDKKIGVVWIDAHADLHSPYTSPSGNIHGMPLAAALNEDNLACQKNKLSEETLTNWEQLKSLEGIKPKITHDSLIYFGVRDTEEEEDYLINKHQIKNYTVAEYRYKGTTTCLNESVEKLSACDFIYVSFDVDSLDCDLISKGTGTPVSKGFDQYEIIEIIAAFIKTGKVCALEVVEVNPTLDEKGNKMAEVAFEVINKITPLIQQYNIK
ncbi:MAG: arginase [Vicingaceae bacterium]